jgi:uncharacterized GH25 family protein
MKKVALLLIVIVVSLVAVAHEFWFMPDKFNYSPGETANIRFRVGEDFVGENWSGNREKVQQLFHFTPMGEVIDIADKLSGNKGDSLQLLLKDEGTHMVTYNGKNSFISLEAEKFNDYLKEDGLDNVIAYRKQHQEENKKSTEHYQRSIKTILQAGSRTTNVCTGPTTLPLDIIPDANPYAVPANNMGRPDYVRFKVLFKGMPVANVLVRNWYYSLDKRLQTDTFRTNRRGYITLKKHSGPNLVSCVYMEHTPADPEAQWQSYWGSVSFDLRFYFPQISTD